MPTTIKPLNVTICALRVDEKKITPALFQQFENGCLLSDIGWPGIKDGEDELYSTPFAILGRHSYKVDDSYQRKVPFLYCVKHEIRVSTLSYLRDQSARKLERIRSELIGDTQKLSDTSGLISKKPIDGIARLADHGLTGGWPFNDSRAFFHWKPKLINSDPFSVAFNPIQVKMLADYGAASKQLIAVNWNSSDSYAQAEEEKAQKIESLKLSIKDSKVDTLVQRWFSLNADLMANELAEVAALIKRYEAHLIELENEIMESPKVQSGTKTSVGDDNLLEARRSTRGKVSPIFAQIS